MSDKLRSVLISEEVYNATCDLFECHAPDQVISDIMREIVKHKIEDKDEKEQEEMQESEALLKVQKFMLIRDFASIKKPPKRGVDKTPMREPQPCAICRELAPIRKKVADLTHCYFCTFEPDSDEYSSCPTLPVCADCAEGCREVFIQDNGR
jgi:hypothetical protein